MTATNAWDQDGVRTNGTGTPNPSKGMEQNVIMGLGWFSIGLGVAELVSPGSVSRLIGVKDDANTRKLLRGYGMREIAAGFGILTHRRPTKWLWSRVAGDVMDLASLASAMQSDHNNRGRMVAATTAVAGITALDVMCARRLAAEDSDEAAPQAAKKADKATKVTRSVIVDRPAQEAYDFWRNFGNLPRFMTYLESVEATGDNRSHWRAKGMAGITTEWDAELVRDEPGRVISWRSDKGSTFENAGSVRFEKAPGGRGTMVRVEMDIAPYGGTLQSIAGKILGTDIGMRIQHDLRNFKQVMELGEVTESDASIHSGMHPAQPPREPYVAGKLID